MSKKTILNKEHAEAIARKLEARLEERREHTIAVVYACNLRIGQFGIRRGHKSLGHDYIPQQIFFPTGQCLKLAQCTLYRPDWVKSLQAQGRIPKDCFDKEEVLVSKTSTRPKKHVHRKK